MTKYEDLKQRIEALDNGRDKEADDILEELKTFINRDKSLNIQIVRYDNSNYSGDIRISFAFDVDLFKKEFTPQCGKMTAFKNALLWLLDNSNIPKVDKKKQEKIEKLEIRIEEEAQRVIDLQEELDELKEK